jgi:ribosome recycling factor
VKEVERALSKSDLGAQPTVDGDTIRVTVPTMTEERREEIVRMVGERLEHARIAIKTKRGELLKSLKNDQKSGVLSEDLFFSKEKELQKAVDAVNASVQELADKKIREVRTV